MKILKLVVLTAVGVIVAACQPADGNRQGSEIEYLNMPGNEGSGLPFSSAVRVDNTLYLSGVIGVIPGTLQVPESGIEEEARFALEEIKRRWKAPALQWIAWLSARCFLPTKATGPLSTRFT